MSLRLDSNTVKSIIVGIFALGGLLGAPLVTPEEQQAVVNWVLGALVFASQVSAWYHRVNLKHN